MSTLPDSRVALIGCGGLGGPIAYALAAAGVHLTLCDPDAVELSNLQRQVQFSMPYLGRPKTVSLAQELRRRGHVPGWVRPLSARFCADTADDILAGADLVIDGSDDPATKFAVNDEAMRRGIPAVIASVARYEGQVLRAVPGGPCYRCLFETPPEGDEADAASCGNAGVLGACVAAIAGRAARAALELLSGDRSGPPLEVSGDLRRGGATRAVVFSRRPDCPACAGYDRSAAGPAPTAVHH